MKKFLIMFLFFAGVVCAQQDWTFIKDLTPVVKSDSNYVLIVESPTTTFKQTLRNLTRSQKISWLPLTTRLDKEDYLVLQHRNGGLDTIKSIKAKNFYSSLMKDSVSVAIGIAKTLIESEITATENNLQAQINLKASVASKDSLRSRMSAAESSILTKAGLNQLDNVRDSVWAELALKAKVTSMDSLRSRMGSAESAILLKAGKAEVDGLRDSLWASVVLKANVNSVDSLRNRMNSAEASITLKAGKTEVDGLRDSVWASIVLKVSANDVYSLLEILPDSVKIQSKNIILDGIAVANSLVGKTIEGNGSMTINAYGGLTLSSTSSARTVQVTALHTFIDAGVELGITSPAVTINTYPVLTTSNIGSYAITSESDPTVYAWAKASGKPSYTAGEVGAVPTSRSITINGMSYDLSADRSWSVSASVAWADVTGKPSTFAPISHGNEAHSSTFITADALTGYLNGSSSLNPANVSQTASYRFVTDSDQTFWSNKQAALGFLNLGAEFTIQSGGGGTLKLTNTYLQSESDPIFVNSSAYGIIGSDITNWNGKSVVSLGSGSATSIYVASTSGGSPTRQLQLRDITINGSSYSLVAP